MSKITHRLVADRVTCVLYAAREFGLRNANHNAKRLQRAEGSTALWIVPGAGIFAPSGTKSQCEAWLPRVAEFAAYARGQLGKPLTGLIRVERG